jgi:hypothetical protein
MKRIALVLATSVSCITIQGTILEMNPAKLFSPAETPEKSGVQFELKNKSKRPLWIAIVNGGSLTSSQAEKVDEGVTIQPGGRPLNLSRETQLAVWYSDPGTITFEEAILGIVGPKKFQPKPNKLYSFAKNKTLYLTWDPSNYARPQTGPLGELRSVLGKTSSLGKKLSRTDTNLSLENNIGKDEIKELP